MMLTQLGKALKSVSQEEIKLDKQIKVVLSQKPILTRILKESVAECRDLSYAQIEACIEGEPQVDEVPVNAMTITGQSQEDYQPDEGLIKYDVRTYLKLPSMETSEYVKILIDVEAQKDDSPGYDIPIRALFYCCRMVSAQLNREFTTNSDDQKKYGNIKKVYSIWICTETAQYKANTISRYHMNEEMLVGEKPQDVRYDLLEAIIINISKNHNIDNCDNATISFLTDLFDETQTAEEKLDRLENKHHLPVTEKISKEVIAMCTYTTELKKSNISEASRKIALNLLAMGLPLDDIAKACELPLEDVRKIAEERNLQLV